MQRKVANSNLLAGIVSKLYCKYLVLFLFNLKSSMSPHCRYYLDKDADITPFNRQIAISLRKSLEQFAQSNDIPLTALKELKKKRDRKVVCKTFHHAGLVVPFDRKTELGYRGLIDTEAKLKKILARFDLAKGDEKLIASAMEELQPFITAANIGRSRYSDFILSDID